MQNLLLFLPLICLNANPQSGGVNAKKDNLSKFHLSFWANVQGLLAYASFQLQPAWVPLMLLLHVYGVLLSCIYLSS
jgi:hypothetical protein